MKFKIALLLFFITVKSYTQNDVYVFKDSSNEFTIENINNAEFLPVEKQILEKYSDDSYWFKIPAHKTTSKYIFRFVYERYNNANVYQNSKKLEKLSNQRFLSYQFSREYDVYVQINPKLHSFIPFELLPEEQSILKNNNQLLLNGFYYGFAFLIIIYNFFYYFLFKDEAFLYYALFLATMAFGIFTMDGMLNFYNVNESTNDFIMVLNYISLAFFTSKFANCYLFLDRYYPRLKKSSYAIGIIIIVVGILYLIFKNFYYLFFLGILVFSVLLIYWISAVLLFNKNVYTKILAFAYIIILFSGIDYYIFKFIGISKFNIDHATIKIGAFLEMITLSIAVLYRMKVLKDENLFMRNEIVKYSTEIEHLKINNETINKEDSLDDLSIREREIFDLIVLGKPNKEIANTLNVSINTVKFHIKNIYDKLHIKSRKEAISLDKSFQ
jgi:DNA-binding CsgD family transcriptional regulator